MALIEGLTVAVSIRQQLKAHIESCAGRAPRLDVILVGEDTPSKIYVERKQRACADVGIISQLHRFDTNCTMDTLLKTIQQLNHNPLVDGILVQLPLPAHLDATLVMAALDADKDVDGFHPVNRGKLLMGDPSAFIPCTPLGICELFKYYSIATEGKRVTVIGRSNIVGKPMAALLMQNASYGNATVTVAHSKSNNIDELCREADILIAALGKPHFIGPHMVKEGAVVIDVGMNALEQLSPSGKRRVVGDVNFEAVRDKCSWITPVPGGVGPMTIAMLLANTWTSYQRRMEGSFNNNC
jgi:methylenetetrahydrofolate dehydrogenase (NADP+)/methenyltetrahydrofolate cyclohydrolase